jgi:hypothetical protein
MEAMVDSLYRGARRDHAILSWLLDRQLPVAERLKPLTLLTAFENNELEELKSKRASQLQAANAPVVVNVNDYVDAWYKDVTRRSSADHAARFLRAVRTFVPEGVGVAPEQFSHAELLDWANRLQNPVDDEGLGLSPETARRYRVGLLNFIDHLLALDVVPTNRLAKIAPPKRGKPRDRHLVTSDVLRLISAFADAENEPLQRFVATRGIDICDLPGIQRAAQRGRRRGVRGNRPEGPRRQTEREGRARAWHQDLQPRSGRSCCGVGDAVCDLVRRRSSARRKGVSDHPELLDRERGVHSGDCTAGGNRAGDVR